MVNPFKKKNNINSVQQPANNQNVQDNTQPGIGMVRNQINLNTQAAPPIYNNNIAQNSQFIQPPTNPYQSPPKELTPLANGMKSSMYTPMVAYNPNAVFQQNAQQFTPASTIPPPPPMSNQYPQQSPQFSPSPQRSSDARTLSILPSMRPSTDYFNISTSLLPSPAVYGRIRIPLTATVRPLAYSDVILCSKIRMK